MVMQIGLVVISTHGPNYFDTSEVLQDITSRQIVDYSRSDKIDTVTVMCDMVWMLAHSHQFATHIRRPDRYPHGPHVSARRGSNWGSGGPRCCNLCLFLL